MREGGRYHDHRTRDLLLDKDEPERVRVKARAGSIILDVHSRYTMLYEVQHTVCRTVLRTWRAPGRYGFVLCSRRCTRQLGSWRENVRVNSAALASSD